MKIIEEYIFKEIKQGFNSFKYHLAGYLEQEIRQNNKIYGK